MESYLLCKEKYLLIFIQVFTQNDHLLGDFSAKRISEISRAKSELHGYVKTTTDCLGRIKKTGGINFFFFTSFSYNVSDDLKNSLTGNLHKSVELVDVLQDNSHQFTAAIEMILTKLKTDDQKLKESFRLLIDNQTVNFTF